MDRTPREKEAGEQRTKAGEAEAKVQEYKSGAESTKKRLTNAQKELTKAIRACNSTEVGSEAKLEARNTELQKLPAAIAQASHLQGQLKASKTKYDTDLEFTDANFKPFEKRTRMAQDQSNNSRKAMSQRVKEH